MRTLTAPSVPVRWYSVLPNPGASLTSITDTVREEEAEAVPSDS